MKPAPAGRFETPAERLAVLPFTGLAGSGRVATKGQQLTDTLDDAGLAYDPAVRSMFYDDPFTLPWKRRNEVAVTLRD